MTANGALRTQSQPWPNAARAWYAVIILAVVLMLGTTETQIITFLIRPIKRDFGLTDLQMSVLIGAAPSIFYACVGFPLARLVDSLRRNTLLSLALGVGGLATSLAGLTQHFWQFAVCRMAVGGGSAISNPGTYSLLADHFPRERLTRAIAVLTLGLVVARGLAPIIGAALVGLAATWGAMHFFGLVLHEWQIVVVMTGSLGLVAAVLILTVMEPPRRGAISAGKRLPIAEVFRYIWRHRSLYLPQFFALAFFQAESIGIDLWRIEFLRRTYGWTPQFSGTVLGASGLAASLLGLVIGTRLTEWYTKRHDDANLRTVSRCYLIAPIFATAAPLMPSPWLSIICSSITGMLGMACVAPQNAALQSITPNEMRGQVTAIFYFIMAVVGTGMGPSLMAFITDVVIGDESKIRYAMSICAAVMTPVAAACMWAAVRPYGLAIGEIKAREALP
jgi:MFS family permease